LIGLAALEIDALLAEPQYAALRSFPRAKLIELFLWEMTAHVSDMAARMIEDSDNG
jgi:hypothetical protein